VQVNGRSSDTGSTSATLQLRLNDDTTANRHVRIVNAAGASGTVFVLGSIPASQTNTDRTGMSVLTLGKLSGGYPVLTGQNTLAASTGTTVSTNTFSGMFTDGAQNITKLSFLLSAGNFVADSQFIVEGCA
jgi:hypothetical protein